MAKFKCTYKRAKTLEQKQEIITRLLSLWLKHPTWRLGQLFANYYSVNMDLFFIEDYDLIKVLEKKGKANA